MATVTDLEEVRTKRSIAGLYAQHDALAVEGRCDPVFSACGMSIIDDVEFFLSHDQYRDVFERLLGQHLKEFSHLLLKGKTDD